MWDPYAKFESTTLPNGLTVYACQWPDRECEELRFVVHSGSSRDPVGLEGLAHYVEHLVPNNAGMPESDLRAFFAHHGGNVCLGRTGYDQIGYGCLVPIDWRVCREAFYIFGRMLLKAALNHAIEQERRVVLREFEEDYPVQFKFQMQLDRLRALYPNHPIARNVGSIGEPETIRRMTQPDAQAYYDRYYVPANMSIIGVGGMSLDEVVQLVSDSPFAGLKVGQRALRDPPIEEFAPLVERQKIYRMSDYVKVQLSTASYYGSNRIPVRFDVLLLDIVSRILNRILYKTVRKELGWTYDIGSEIWSRSVVRELRIDCGSLDVVGIHQLEGVIESSIASISGREDLFEEQKHCALARRGFSDENCDSTADGADSMLCRYGRIVTLAEERERIERFTMRDVEALLPYLASEKRFTRIITP